MDKKIIAFDDTEISTYFHDDRIPKESSHWICLSVVLTFGTARFFIDKCKKVVFRDFYFWYI